MIDEKLNKYLCKNTQAKLHWLNNGEEEFSNVTVN